MIKKFIILFAIFLSFGLGAYAFDIGDSQILANPFSSPEVQKYSLEVGKKIISNFAMPDTQENLATIVLFKVSPDGKLKSYEIQQSSGNKDYDSRVIAAVKKSAPYPVPQFQEAEEVAVILNMDLSVIRLIKMLSDGGLDLNNLLQDFKAPETLKPKLKNQQAGGKQFVNPYDFE